MSAVQLTKLQMGAETSAYTIHAATNVWRGNGKFTNDVTINNRDENVGVLVDIDSPYTAAEGATLTLNERPASYEQVGYLLDMSMNAVTAASNSGTPTSYKYIYVPSVTTEPTTFATYTFEGGDGTQGYVFNGCVCKEFKLSGAPKQPVMMSATLAACRMAKQAFTGSIAIPSEEEILFQKTKLYLDLAAGTIGATNHPDFLGFDMTVTSGLDSFYRGDGNLYAIAKPSKFEVKGSFTILHDSLGVAQYDDYVAMTGQRLRILSEGVAFAGSPGTYKNKTLNTDAFIHIDKTDVLDVINGRNVVKVNWSARYHMPDKIEFKIDDPATLEWADTIAFAEGNQRTIMRTMARYLVVNGAKMQYEKALIYLSHLPAMYVKALSDRFSEVVGETVLPLALEPTLSA
jgi:hypothetical protein